MGCCRPTAYPRTLPVRPSRKPSQVCEQGYAETAVLVDADGVRQAVLRGDRAGSHTLDSAYDKAYTAASFKTDTSALLSASKSAPGFSNLFTQLPHLMLFGGGIVIKVGDEVIGAIGAAGAPGANLDDACARAGARQDPRPAQIIPRSLRFNTTSAGPARARPGSSGSAAD